MEAHEARVNITYAGTNGDLPDPIPFDSQDEVVRRIVEEAIRTGGVPGINVDSDVDLSGYVVDRFGPNEARPNFLLSVRPKAPFGRALLPGA
jgi:hypothetical protein